jgi:hypothetical protein
VEIHVIGRFGNYRNPNVQFILGTKTERSIGLQLPTGPTRPTLPLYRFTVEVLFRSVGTQAPWKELHMLVKRTFDAENRLCWGERVNFELASDREHVLGCPVEEV